MKNGEFSVMIGFVEKGQIAGRRRTGAGQGALHVRSAAARLLATRRRRRASRLPGDEPRRTRRRRVMVQSHSRSPACPSQGPGHPSRPRCGDVFGGVKLALVARGEADLYVNEYTQFHDWDIAAGHISWRKRAAP